MELKIYVCEDNGQVINVATSYMLSQEGISPEEAKQLEGVKEHTIVIRPFTGAHDRACSNKSATNLSRWADAVVEEAVVNWTLDKAILDENGKEIARELYPHTEQGVLSMPILLANVIRLVVQDAVYTPVRNPFKKPQ